MTIGGERFGTGFLVPNMTAAAITTIPLRALRDWCKGGGIKARQSLIRRGLLIWDVRGLRMVATYRGRPRLR
jgi:hypothetical protein